MSAFENVLKAIRENEIGDKIQLTEYLLNMLGNIKKLKENDRSVLADFAGEQVRSMLEEIPKQTTPHEVDACCQYAQRVMALFPVVYPTKEAIPEQTRSDVQAIIALMDQKQPVDAAVRAAFVRKKIDSADIERLIAAAAAAPSEFEKGKLYVGLHGYAECIPGIPADAKEKLTAYLEAELERYLRIPEPDEDVLSAWEIAADVAKYFKSAKNGELLLETLKTNRSNIGFYAAESLIRYGIPLPAESVAALAADPVYSNLTYELLKKHGMTSLFPAEYAAPEKLAESDLIHWLTYPTELGRVPDQIEYLGKITYLFRKEKYYVFRFRSDSGTLDEDTRGKWLIGWSSEEGGTFSNFDLLIRFEKETTEKTLKNIKKQLIGK